MCLHGARACAGGRMALGRWIRRQSYTCRAAAPSPSRSAAVVGNAVATRWSDRMARRTAKDPLEGGFPNALLCYIGPHETISLALLLLSPTGGDGSARAIPHQRPVCTSNGPFCILGLLVHQPHEKIDHVEATRQPSTAPSRPSRLTDRTWPDAVLTQRARCGAASTCATATRR